MAKQLWLFDADVLRMKLVDLERPGAEVEFDPDEAEALGAFEEPALSTQEAFASFVDREDKAEVGR